MVYNISFHNQVIVKEALRLQPNWNEKSKSLYDTLEYKSEKRVSSSYIKQAQSASL